MLSEPPRCRPVPVRALKGADSPVRALKGADSPRGLHRGHSPGHMSPPGARSTGGGWLLPASWPDPNRLRQVNPDHDETYRGAGPFGQDALLRVSPIADPWSAPMPRPHGRKPLAVEATDPGGEGLVVPSSDLVGGRRVAGALRNGQERSGALHLRGGGAERAAQAGQLLALIHRERAKRIFPVARHGTPRGTRITAPLYQFQGQMTH